MSLIVSRSRGRFPQRRFKDNRAPVAQITPNFQTEESTTVDIHALFSFDPDGDPFTLSWSLVSRPGGSTATLTTIDDTHRQLTPDLPGNYRVRVTATDDGGASRGLSGPALSSTADCVVTAISPAEQPATTIKTTHGVFIGTNNPSRVAGYETSDGINRPLVGPIMDYTGGGGTTWTSWLNLWKATMAAWAPRCAGSSPSNDLLISLNPWPTADTVSTLAEAATGAYNANYTAWAEAIVPAGYDPAHIIVRPMWEFNGAFYEWGITNAINGGTSVSIPNYRATFQHMVTAMRAVHPELRFAWNLLSRSGSVANAEAAYPGDEYVDYIEMDVYDRDDPIYPPQNSTTWASVWNRILSSHPSGLTLQWQKTFAVRHEKQLAYGEWGNVWRTDGNGGQDNALFPTNFCLWLVDLCLQNLLGYHCPFEFDEKSGNNDRQLHQLPGNPANRDMPNARAASDLYLKG